MKVIEMTEEEIRKFHALMDRAVQGETVNYAEERLDDGSFLGVSVVKTQDHVASPIEHKVPIFKKPTRDTF